jgi:hypothetical protein
VQRIVHYFFEINQLNIWKMKHKKNILVNAIAAIALVTLAIPEMLVVLTMMCRLKN